MYIKSKYNVHTCKWLRMIWCHTTVFFFRVEWICRWWIVWFANLGCCATVGTRSILGTKTVAVGWVTWKRVLFIISSNLIHVLSRTYSYTSYHPIAFYSPYLQYIRTFSSAPNHTEAWWPSRPGREPLGRVAVVPAAFPLRSWTFAGSQVPVGDAGDRMTHDRYPDLDVTGLTGYIM